MGTCDFVWVFCAGVLGLGCVSATGDAPTGDQPSEVRTPIDSPCEGVRAPGGHCGSYVEGNITINTRWTRARSPYTLTGDLAVAPGATLTIDPGVAVYGDEHRFQIFGRLVARGNATGRISFTNVALLAGGLGGPEQPYRMELVLVDFRGGDLHPPTGGMNYGSLLLTDSVIEDTAQYIYLVYPTSPCLIERNVFRRAGGVSAGTNENITVTIRNNLFERQTFVAVDVFATYDRSSVTVDRNTFASRDRIAVQIGSGNTSAPNVSARNNFWNTTDANVISSMIVDGSDGGGQTVIEFNPFLFAPDPSTPQSTLTCARGTVLCGTRCVMLDSDPDNCGACDTACRSDDVCVDAFCVPSCVGNRCI